MQTQLSEGADCRACHLGTKGELLGGCAPLGSRPHYQARSSICVPDQPQVPLHHTPLIGKVIQHSCKCHKAEAPMPASTLLMQLMSHENAYLCAIFLLC